MHLPPAPASPDPGGTAAKPWLAFYGNAASLGDLTAAGARLSRIDIDADPAQQNFSAQNIAALKAGGALVFSYLNVGACEQFRSYWGSAPPGFLSCGQNAKAWRGTYAGYPNETWMDPSDPDWQALLLDVVAPRLVAMGVDGFFLDNMEIVEHGTSTDNGPCDAACAQGGLDLVRKLHERYPRHQIWMQNATSALTRLGRTGGVPFASLIDGISREEVYTAGTNAVAEQQLLEWQAMGLMPRGRPFWIGTEDYVGSCGNSGAAQSIYARSRSRGFQPYVADASAGQQKPCWWGF